MRSHTHAHHTHMYTTHTDYAHMYTHTHHMYTGHTNTEGERKDGRKGLPVKLVEKKNENHRFRYVLLSEIKIVPHFSLNDTRES